MNLLPADLQMGAVTLRVANVDAMLKFYTDGVGLEVIATSGNGYVLGHGDDQVLFLEHSPHLNQAGSHEAGLFHTAFLFETEAELAYVVASVASKYPGTFTGSADHLVSKAFYFDDLEGNGVELYWDRPRAQWQIDGTTIKMDTLPLDPNAYLNEHLKDMDSTKAGIGHVHLSVGDLVQAKDFYVDTLGFDLTFNYANTAMFVSAGGYHHHMAMNIWRSRGAGVRQQTLGLGDMEIKLGSSDAVTAVLDRAKFNNRAARDNGDSVIINDPWGNQVTVRA